MSAVSPADGLSSCIREVPEAVDPRHLIPGERFPADVDEGRGRPMRPMTDSVIKGVSQMAGEPSSVVEVFADVSCPFTHVGLRRFVDHRRDAGHGDVRLRVRAWPLEIINGHPLDPQVIAEEVEALRAAVAPDLFEEFRSSRFPRTSKPAFALVAAAYRQSLVAGEEVSLFLRDLLFEQGRDISDATVLADVGARFGLRPTGADRAAMDADYAEGRERGVIGSPHFFTPSGSFFCPTLDISRDDEGELHVAIDRAAFEDFLSACFAG